MIYLGDCFEVMKSIESNSIDFILCDLPYNLTALNWDDKIDLDLLWTHYKRIIKPNGVIALHSNQPFTTDLINSNRKWFKYNYIWIKTQAANFQLAKKMPLKKHEDVCIFYGKTPLYQPQMTIGLPKMKRIGEKKYQERKSEMYLSSRPDNLENVMSDTYYPTTILQFPSVSRNKSKHPTEKPIALEEFLIKTYTKEGDIVLDNCAGSGTTGVACVNTNRNYILIEKDPKYYEIICDRLK
jgi:site-specific DNA-methyltransferase (adenine-specific)